MSRKLFLVTFLAVLICFVAVPYAFACTGIYVGKNLTADGSVLIGQNGDENSSHWIEVIPRQKHAPGAVLEVGAGPEADYPGVRTTIPQVSETNKYITLRYSCYAGFPKPIENGGINEYQVSVVDVWSPSREELCKMTPAGQKGLSYSDQARVAMERAKTAREAVAIIGEMIEKYGDSTYGGNTHLIADSEEGWIVEEFAGGQGLWIAKRLGSNDFYITRPGYIEEIPLNFKEDPNYMGSDNFISFAVEQGWYDPDSGKPFNVSEVYEEDRDSNKPGHQAKSPEVVEAEKILKDILKKRKITVKDVMDLLKTRPYSNRGTKYGQVAQLRSNMPNELGVLWIAVGPTEASTFIPYYIGIKDVPTEYKEHRYLTVGEAERFSLPVERQGQETTSYAYRTFDRLYMLADEHYKEFYPEVLQTLNAFGQQLLTRQKTVESTALQLYKSGNADLAREYLTYYCNTEALKGMQIAETLANNLEVRTKLLYGINEFQKAE